MFVTPAPIRLLIFFALPRKIMVSAMVLFQVDPVRPIFVAVPLVIVVMFFVVVGARVILGLQRRGRHCHWDDEGGAQ